jgi:hypothetical protein
VRILGRRGGAGRREIFSKKFSGLGDDKLPSDSTFCFDLCRLICGSQGTLGIVTKINFQLVPIDHYSNLLAVFMPNLDHLGKVVAEITPFKPDSLETYDDYSMKLALQFFFEFFKSLGFWGRLSLGLNLSQKQILIRFL